MLTAWRLIKTKHLSHAFDGEGPRLYGGRWNSPGTRVVYVSESLALAALEVLVHLQASSVLSAYSAVKVSFDDSLATAVDLSTLPANWRNSPPPAELQAIGDEWVAKGASAVLKVPSAVIDTERNFLINPIHEEFNRIVIEPPQAFEFYSRLRKGG